MRYKEVSLLVGMDKENKKINLIFLEIYHSISKVIFMSLIIWIIEYKNLKLIRIKNINANNLTFDKWTFCFFYKYITLYIWSQFLFASTQSIRLIDITQQQIEENK
jgi:hypothetical protein